MSLSQTAKSQAPVNDDCVNALPIDITGGGFDLGMFNSPVIELSNATIQSGESFASAILGSGLSHKSVINPASLAFRLLDGPLDSRCRGGS